jgi:hypothetical protein
LIVCIVTIDHYLSTAELRQPALDLFQCLRWETARWQPENQNICEGLGVAEAPEPGPQHPNS